MKSESIKSIYKGLRYFLLICLISTVILSFFDLYGNIPRIFLGVFALIGFVNTYEYKEIMKEEKLSASSTALIATTLVVCAGYVLVMFFLLGRDFMWHMMR